MELEAVKPSLAFWVQHVAEDVFPFAFPSTILKSDGLYRQFNMQGEFIEQVWYRFPAYSRFLEWAEEFDFVG